MKPFLILCITCFAGVNSFLLNDGTVKQESLEDKVIQKCARELNVDAKKYINADLSSVHSEHLDDETTCVVACSFRSLITDSYLAQELTGSTNKDTLYNGFIKLTDEAFKTGFGDKSIGYSREDIVNKVKTCHAQEATECGFFKCVEVYKKPINLVATHYFVNNYLQLTEKN